jgi:hypothetical protein
MRQAPQGEGRMAFLRQIETLENCSFLFFSWQETVTNAF